MKRFFFPVAMLISVATSATVTVTPISTDYSNKKVTFKVAWSGTVVPHNNRVWVWIDFCPVTGAVPTTSFTTATVSNPTITGGNGSTVTSTARGFFIQYTNTNNAGTTVTATLSNAPDAPQKFNWCAYGSDMPPNATVNANGGYTLRGTKPFTINGAPGHNSNAFGAGTCITSITDPTGRPDGFAGTPTISTSNPVARCSGNAVTLNATASGGTTTAMTYTWTIGSATYTSTTNSYTTGALSSSAAFTVWVKNENNCISGTATGNITINGPGGHDQSAACGCVVGTTDCSGTCKTIGTTQVLGNCTSICNVRNAVVYDQCGKGTNKTVPDNTCTAGCSPCQAGWSWYPNITEDHCQNYCFHTLGVPGWQPKNGGCCCQE